MGTKKSRKLSILAIISEIFQILLIIFLVVFSVTTFGGKIPFLAEQGFNFFAVTSGSMTPTIPVGALIRVTGFAPETLQKGDIITFNHSKTDQPSYVTHRIEEVKTSQETKKVVLEESQEETEKTLISYEYITKGDVNNAVDAEPVALSKVVGKYQWHIPYLGYLTAYAQTDLGFILLVIVPAVILIIWEIVSLVLHFMSASKVKSNLEIAKLKKQLAEKEEKNKED